jgi:hypothetical protein
MKPFREQRIPRSTHMTSKSLAKTQEWDAGPRDNVISEGKQLEASPKSKRHTST